MIINHNLQANNAIRQMNVNSNSASKSMQKLSSGLRINSASDDAAGLAISEKMRGQIRGLDQASSNAQDGISLVQTAEGALNETTSILQRMRELSVQSANDTSTNDDRTAIQSEMGQLEDEIDRIGNTTQFNTKNLLDGSMGKAVNTAVANQNTSNVLKVSNAKITGVTDALTNLQDSNGNNLGIASGDTVSISYVKNGTTTTSTVNVTSSTNLSSLDSSIADGSMSIASGAVVLTAGTTGTAGAVEGLTITVKDKDGNTRTAATNALSSFSETRSAADVRSDGTATLQIGANTNQNLSIDINDMRAQALGVSGLQVKTQTQANVAIKVIDNATQKVSAERAKLGAYQNRLEHTINNLGTSSENLTSAESRIRDVDMAKEMSTYSKNNILSQAAQAMLAQANQQPQQVLQLLR
ncbi:flagellin [Clostridium beijerinckii]|uniref:flagellin N-terminal helical domain-containing protein n=1 Tax=Clostridium beijerinckii TaxID=1520 RepID=UPI0013617A17|nr:flagellin [Clostridium beijerinckii]MZK49889.1 flagellin [Clostridium beijerinckii]MZK57848.1 flagellin [Clostridium beijerinckii]MZK68059.1 flagellin [Clostridium beijerinckii]MZK73557.1 flagellin [Clostridium beijerinckii]MZK83139.1 flagellin [Clostridium beijerinckii]